MKLALFALLILFAGLPSIAAAETFLVKDGQPQAEIIVAADPPRMVKLAARELQTYVAKISGAQLPIREEASGNGAIRIYLGDSPESRALGIDARNLKYGAYRMKTGPDYLALVGHDFDFLPPKPSAGSRNDQERAAKEWDRIVAERGQGGPWGFPMTSSYRMFNEPTQTWGHDEGGTLNAVYGFLRSLGVRWYMPGELGEVVPELASIAMPEEGLVEVRPDYALRQFLGPTYMRAPEEAVLWGRRLGLNYGYELLGAGPKTHGLSRVHERAELQQAHPEYYALINGERDTFTRGTGHVCWSSEGMVREAVGYARTVFDLYDEPTLQLSPQDGLRMCQCEDCAQLTPSDAVWGFLDKVAREVAETHPDHLLIGAAYTFYKEPPASIDKLSPNIAVRINNVGRPAFAKEENWTWYQDLVKTWRAKMPTARIVRVENNYYDTVWHPQQMARDLRAMKGISQGEMSEVARANVETGEGGQTWGRPGTNHLNLYVNARFLWDADQDVDALLAEYYDRFYGPASQEMRAAVEYGEASYSMDGKAKLELPARVGLLERLHTARAAAGDGIYGQRIQLIIDEFDPLEELQRKLSTLQKRGETKTLRPWDMGKDKWDEAREQGAIDGKLEEAYWNLQGKLGRLSDGEKPEQATRFQLLTAPDALWVGIRCESEGGVPKLAKRKQDDPAILEEEHVELLLETDQHAFYRIAISPSGAILDTDMTEDGVSGIKWQSNAEFAVHVGEDFWSVEARIPLVTEEQGAGDPVHHMVYQRLPNTLWPWHFNVLRVRGSGEQQEITSFAPSEAGDPLDRLSFGKIAR